MEITVDKRDVYGTVRYYPVCDKARVFARLTNKKTFTERDLYIVKELGYRVLFKQVGELV
jgi:hypothetical protein